MRSSVSTAFKLGAILVGGTSLLATLPMAPSSVAAPKAQTLKWHTSYAEAMKEAKKTGKPLFVDVYTDWCGPCKYLSNVVFKDAKFTKEGQKWVLLKINPEKSKFGAEFARKNGVEGYPWLLMFNAKGEKVGVIPGAIAAEGLVPQMQQAYRKAKGHPPAKRA